MILIEGKLEHNKKDKYNKIKQFEITENLWNKLIEFAETNHYCSKGKYEWNENTLYLCRIKDLDTLLKKQVNGYKEEYLLHEVQREYPGGNIELTRVFKRYEYHATVKNVDLNNKKALIHKKPNNRQIRTGDYKGKEYYVKLSDRVIYEGIKPQDVVVISKMLDGSHLVTSIYEVYTEHIKSNREDLDDILGNY